MTSAYDNYCMTDRQRNWTEWLAEDELAFIRRFVVMSGSLKALAAAYGVTYPTIRLRLDRLIQKLEIVEDQQITDDFERLVRTKFADGRIDAETLKAILTAYRKEQENKK